ncbi:MULTISPECIES: hypothetical protein [unclassified Rhizobium]|uniref:hypothetical protein n=1 Tax=Hyphomicrobiales TaxID=356 RepID=UPI000A689882|nr:hypothetical protein [Rhizobium sp. WW_1]
MTFVHNMRIVASAALLGAVLVGAVLSGADDGHFQDMLKYGGAFIGAALALIVRFSR